jgi:tetratricopeptide (TPR) repeat protein
MSWTLPATMYIPYKPDEGRQNNFLRVQDIMILDLLKTNFDLAKTPNPRPVYFAVTVANSNMIGLRSNLTFEGMLFHVNPKANQNIDPQILKKHLLETYRGHFRGIGDPSVHYDDNVQKLLQNYRSAFLQLSYHYSSLPKDTLVHRQFESLDDRLAHFDEQSNDQKALTLLLLMDSEIPESVRPIGNTDLSIQIGKMYSDLGKPDELRRRLELATTRDDLTFENRSRLAAYWYSSFRDSARAEQIMKDVLGDNPTRDMLYTSATQLFSAGAHALAARYFNKILEMDPNDGQAIGGLMQVYESLGDLQGSRALLENWVNKHPQDRGAKQRLDQVMKQITGDTSTLRVQN